MISLSENHPLRCDKKALILKRINQVLRTRGVAGLIFAAYVRLQRLMPTHAESFRSCESLLRDKDGIEIGGPSQVFAAKGLFPVYPIAGHLDNCNFGGTTVWEGNIKEGQTFQFARNKPAGRQYVVEATAMECVPSSSYDFVLSSHVRRARV